MPINPESEFSALLGSVVFPRWRTQWTIVRVHWAPCIIPNQWEIRWHSLLCLRWCIETDPRPLGPASQQSPPPPPANWCHDLTWRPLVTPEAGVTDLTAHYTRHGGHLDMSRRHWLPPICSCSTPLVLFIVIANTKFLWLIETYN